MAAAHTVKERFESHLAQFICRNMNGCEHRRHILCDIDIIDTDDRNIRTCIMKKGLKGTYDVRVIINDKKYETGVKIEC